ncbi:MAG: c-type cytochrome [Gemmatimonadaceae bacterium]|nr:c-type cytochrome [Gemmatimonadaceae bacterium]
MIRWLKRIGIGILTLVLLIVLAIGTAYAVVGRKLSKRYPTQVASVAVPTDSASIAKGEHFATAVNKCIACHGDNLGGKKIDDDALMGRLYAPNLTSGNGGVAAGYTDADWVRGIRHGVGADGRPLIFMPSEHFYYMNDADLGAVIAYLKTVKPVDYVTPEPRLGPLGRVLHLAVGFPSIPVEVIPKGRTTRPATQPGATVEYGKYLTTIGGCMGCHNPNLSGGGGGEGGVPPANLTPPGLKGWTEADFVKAMRTGVRPGGRVLSAAMPWPYVGKLSDEELRATWLYLQSLPPKKMGE